MLHNFPQNPTPLVGREAALTDILHRLNDPACRLLTLVGVGGVGKTRLAIEAAERAAPTFPDGAHFIALQAIDTTAALIPTFANTLGMQFLGGSDPGQQLIDYLQHRHTLLVIDNFEHLLDAVDLLVDLLAVPHIKLLVTSREALRVREEWQYVVEGLSFPLGENGAALASYGAVQLFVEHGRRLRRDFALSDHSSAVIHICHLTEGHPLALELAAGWIKALTPAQIATEMQSSLDFLATSVRNMPARHRSMTAAFAQSWRLLSPDEARVFRRLSVFRGGFTREAAEHVAGASLSRLAALVDKSLLRVSPTGRYDIHELLRQFGEQQLESAGEVDATRDAHSAYFLNFLAERSETIHTHRIIEILDEIEADFENIRAAWYRAVDQRHDQAIGAAVESLTWYCNRRSRFFDHEVMYTQAHERFAPAPGEHPQLVWAQLLSRRAFLLMIFDSSLSNATLARSYYEQSLAIARLHKHPFEVAYTTMRWGNYLMDMGDVTALSWLELALCLFQELSHQFYVSDCWHLLSSYYADTRQFDQALHYAEQSLTLKQELGEKNSIATVLLHLCWIGFWRGHYAEARVAAAQGLQLMREVRNPDGIVQGLLRLVVLSYCAGQFDELRRYADEINTFSLAANAPNLNVHSTAFLARVNCTVNENYEQTWQNYTLHLKGYTYHSHLLYLMVLCGLGRAADAKQLLVERVKSYPIIIDHPLLVFFLTIAALILAMQGKNERSAELFGYVLSLPSEAVGRFQRWGLVSRTLARVQTDLNTEVYTGAWKRGQNLDPYVALATLVEGWSDSQPKPPSALLDLLTERECEVLNLIAAGLSNAQIAERMTVVVGTVKTHVHRIYNKLGVESRTQAIARARELHLL